MTLSWRVDAPPNLVKLAVGRCLVAVMDRSKWTELGLLTNTTERIDNHPRLIRSLHFGDDDYDGHVHELVSHLLDERKDPEPDPWIPAAQPAPEPLKLHQRFPHLEEITEYLSLPVWLAEHDEKLFERLLGDDADATMPDGTVLSATEFAAARLGVSEMRRQVDRIRRDHSADLNAAERRQLSAVLRSHLSFERVSRYGWAVGGCRSELETFPSQRWQSRDG